MTPRVLGIIVVVSLTGCEAKKPAPPPTPASIKIQLPSPTCREGTTMTLAASVLDADAGVLSIPVAWTAEPPSMVEVNGDKLRCAKEGPATLHAKAGTASATEIIKVTSPLVGRWTRTPDEDDDKGGLVVEVVQEGDELNAHIVQAPTDAALPGIKKSYPRLSAPTILKCLQKTWAPGIKKWKGIKRIGATRWSFSDLGKDVTTTCYEVRSRWIDDYELTLVSEDRADARSSTARSKADVQHWERTAPEPDSAAAPSSDAGAGPDGAVTFEALDAGRVEVDATTHPAKVVKVDIIDVGAPKSAKVRVGDTLQVTVPLWTGTEWKIVGDQPTGRDFVQSYLGPTTNGMKYTFKIGGDAGKRIIKFVGTDANLPNDPPQVATVNVTVE